MLKELAISGTSVAVATTFTNPLDVVKVRLQLATVTTTAAAAATGQPAIPRPGLVSTGYGIVRHEGAAALMKGVGPSVARGVFYGGLRLGLYSPIKAALAPDAPASFATKLAAGTLSGTVAAAVSSPSELIKTRLQAKTAPHAPRQGILDIVRAITLEGGVAALWQGSIPGMVRAGLLTATQCATYDEVKRWVTGATGLAGDHASTHFLCSMATGLITTTATNPADVIKTHMFVGGRQQASVVACARSVWATGGLPAFFKGWTANYARLGPQTVIIFLVNERLRQLLQMDGL